MTELGDNVVPFPKGQFERDQNQRIAALDDLPVRTAHVVGACFHNQHGAWINEGARTVTCRGCDVALDPIEVIAWLARDRENLVLRGRSLRREVDDLTIRVDDLKRAEKNAKSRIRKARLRRDDRDALIAAASVRNEFGVGIPIGGYRPWENLSDPQRSVVLEKVELIIEAYAGALEGAEPEAVVA